MIHINYLKKRYYYQIKAKTLKQLKVLKDNEFVDNKLNYYLKLTDSPAPRFYDQTKIHKPGVSIRSIVYVLYIVSFYTFYTFYTFY